MDIDAFTDGYLYKTAINSAIPGLVGAGVSGGVSTVGAGIHNIKTLAILLPILIGVSAGASVSKLTSPGNTDTKNMQKALLAAEMDETLAELRRKKDFAEHKTNSRDDQREIRI